jgi:hypothetical protein
LNFNKGSTSQSIRGNQVKRLLLLIVAIIMSMLVACEEADTTPPTVTITSPQDGSTVAEVISITCLSTDNEGVKQVELWVDGVSTGVTDNSEPYSLDWNTTTYDDGSPYTITVRSYDTNNNKTDSEPITLTVDNSGSFPHLISIISIVYEDRSFTITWNQSSDTDFGGYQLWKSDEPTMSNYEIVYSTETVSETHYVDNDINPLVFQYYRVVVSDTPGLETKGQIVSNPRIPVPPTINVTSVTYDLTELVVTWSQSEDDDFASYELLSSEAQSGERISIALYTDVNTTSRIITEFSPLQENWYWVAVTDYWGQKVVGDGLTNQIDNPPSISEIYPIVFENGMFTINWSQNNDDDFVSYSLYESLYDDMNSQTEVLTTNNHTVTNTQLSIDEDEIRYFQIVTEDFWGLRSVSDIEFGHSHNWFVKTFGDLNSDVGYSVKQVADGYVITGLTDNGDNQLWLIKTDTQGSEQWSHIFGGSNSDVGYSVQQTPDDGYIVTGFTSSFGNGSSDVWLIKTDSQGNEEWNQTFGGSGSDIGRSVLQTGDGGYVVAGYTNSFGNGGEDVWLIKTDSQGGEEWSQTFGGSGSEFGFSVKQSDDGGYIVAGNTNSFGNGSSDVWLIKTDSQGNEEWNQTFGGSDGDTGFSTLLADDGGYVVAGNTNSFGNGMDDVWLIKTDSQGNEEWNQTFGEGYSEGCRSIEHTTDGGYVIAGSNSHRQGMWLIKTDSQGNEEWDKEFAGYSYEWGNAVQQTLEGGYVVLGSTRSFGNGSDDVWLIKTDSQGNTIPESEWE